MARRGKRSCRFSARLRSERPFKPGFELSVFVPHAERPASRWPLLAIRRHTATAPLRPSSRDAASSFPRLADDLLDGELLRVCRDPDRRAIEPPDPGGPGDCPGRGHLRRPVQGAHLVPPADDDRGASDRWTCSTPGRVCERSKSLLGGSRTALRREWPGVSGSATMPIPAAPAPACTAGRWNNPGAGRGLHRRHRSTGGPFSSWPIETGRQYDMVAVNVDLKTHAMADRPFSATMDNSLHAGPAGRLSPRSHWLTESLVTLRYIANTVWLTCSRSRRARISSAENLRTGVKQDWSNRRIVCLSKSPASCRSSAVSWIAAFTLLL